MEYRQISDDYSVSGQIQPQDIAAIKEAGLTGKVFLATSGGGERKGAVRRWSSQLGRCHHAAGIQQQARAAVRAHQAEREGPR